MQKNSPRHQHGGFQCGGFTLIELLVVMAVLITLMGLTFAAVNHLGRDEKIGGGSRQVQSMLEGAKDRALHARAPRGVRFIRHRNDNKFVTSMVYIGSPGTFDQGVIEIAADKLTITSTAIAHWKTLFDKELIGTGTRIKIGGANALYTIKEVDAANGKWTLTREFLDAAVTGPTENLSYELFLAPIVLPNQEPHQLPEGVVIDLTHSSPAGGWNNGHLDIMFSPGGTVVGQAATVGHIHLLITDPSDADFTAGHDDKEFSETIVTVTTQTGTVSTHSVHSTSTPFRNAETGVETRP